MAAMAREETVERSPPKSWGRGPAEEDLIRPKIGDDGGNHDVDA